MDGAIRFTGPDARTFLQGQLTNDVRLLAPDKPVLAAFCTSQGRVVAVLQLVEDDGGIVALLPASMVELTIGKLRRYILRAKVTMADASGETALQSRLRAATNDTRLQDIAAGRPQLYPETSELFVAQMLNLDLIGGISFDKGCYTGQEIIARAHYRGQVKRRMLRYQVPTLGELNRGDVIQIDRNHSGRIVEWALRPDGTVEFLAIVSQQPGDAEDSRSIPNITQLPLPYSVPS